MKKLNKAFMAKAIALVMLITFGIFNKGSGQLVAGWDFQTITNGGTAILAAPNTPTTIVANFGSGAMYLNGTNGSSTWITTTSGNQLTAFAGTAVNAGTGFSTVTTSPASLALVNQTANTKSVTFRFNMTGLSNLVVSYATQRTATGFTSQFWEYSTNGTVWTTAQTVSSIPTLFDQVTLNVITGLNNAANAYLRLTVTGNTSVSGNNRLDNIQLNTYPQISLATDYFRSKQSGVWSSASTWESSPDAMTWYSSSLVPTSSAQGIQIRSTHTVIINSYSSAKLLTIDAGGILSHTNSFGSFNLTITDDGTSLFDFTVNGRYELNGTAPVLNAGSSVVIGSNGEVRANANGSPGQSDDFARNTQVFFNTNSLFNWNNTLQFETNGVAYFPNASITDKAIFRISSPPSLPLGGLGVTTFNGKFETASGISATFESDGVKIFRDGLGGAGTLIHSSTCGPFRITSATAVIDGSLTVDIENSSVSGDDLEIPSGANVTMSGTATVNLGRSPNTQASLFVGGVLTANGRLNIKSDANGTARVAQITTGTINGNVTIERFIPAKRAWRLLTAPIKNEAANTQTINQAWQEGATPNPSTVLLNDPVPLYGTQITKNRDQDIVNGYDANLQANPSIFSMDTAAPAIIPSMFTPIKTNKSYFLFVRGNRANQINLGTSAPTSTTTLRTTGTINQGGLGQGITRAAGQYFGIGNPYPSSIDITNVLTRSYPGIDSNTFAIWDPGINPYGAYITYLNGLSATSTNYPTTASLFGIQSGQAFILKARTANPSVSFLESDKVATSSSSVFARPAPPSLQIQLRDGDREQYDMVMIGFADSATAPKFGKNGEEMTLSQNGSRLAIQIQPLHEKDTFYVEFNKLTQRTYHLRMIGDLQELDTKLELVDRLTDEHIELKAGTSGYSFTVTADSATFKNRFMVIANTKPKPVYTTVWNELFVYPNPTKGVMRIFVEEKLYTGRVMITDLSGRLIREIVCTNSNINCSFLQTGLYILKAGNKVTKFIKQ